MKERLNKMFVDFAKKADQIKKSHPFDFDIPFKAMAFSGVPYKQVVTLCPGSRTLCALQEWPPFCLDFADVDIVVFERVQMNLREFDVVFVLKDYEQPPIRITTIPQHHLDK